MGIEIGGLELFLENGGLPEMPERLYAKLIKRDGKLCGICGKPLPKRRHGGNIQIDHVIPRLRGGSDSMNNLRLSHKRCNRERSAPSVGELIANGECDEDYVDYNEYPPGVVGVRIYIGCGAETTAMAESDNFRDIILGRR